VSAVDELNPWIPQHIRKLMDGVYGAYKDDEILDDVDQIGLRRGRPMSLRDRRLIAAAIVEIRQERGESAAGDSGLARPDLWTKANWLAIVKAYRACGSRATQQAVAEAMGFDSEQPVRDRLRSVNVPDWRAVHDLIATGPGGSG
jgi:hypothetical protein